MTKTSELTNREKMIYKVLEENRGKVVYRDELHKLIDPDNLPHSNVVDVHIKNLRRKLVGVEITTVRSEGYMLV